MVRWCSTHGHGFTVYPLGHVPYGRRLVAPVSEDGSLLRRAADETPEDTRGDLSWEQTVFVAAVDAARGVCWPRSRWPWDEGPRPDPTLPGLWATQQRWMLRSAALLGIAPGLEASAREQLAWQLDVPSLVLIEGARSFIEARGYQARGVVISRVLRQLPPRPCLAGDLVAAGHVAGLWGRPSRWDPGGARVDGRHRLFRTAGTPGGVPRSGTVPGPTTFES